MPRRDRRRRVAPFPSDRQDGGPNMGKRAEYAELVTARKACQLCVGLVNPSVIDGGRLDSDHIGPWSLWQGNMDAAVMVVGQDWGDTTYFLDRKGTEGPKNPTNLALVELMGIAGIAIGDPGVAVGRDVEFFTNAILCLKEGGLQGKVQPAWFSNCAPFLRRKVEIVKPAVVVGLGERAYRAILGGFGMKSRAFRTEVDDEGGTLLPNGTRAFAVYHCGARIRNTHRPMAMQREDWKRMRPFVAKVG